MTEVCRRPLTVRKTDFFIGAAVVVVAAAATGASHHAHATGRAVHARQVVQTAADRLTYQAISDAWAQTKLGNQAPFEAIRRGVPLPYLAAHEELGAALVLSFAGQSGTCVDLVSRPVTNSVRTRRC